MIIMTKITKEFKETKPSLLFHTISLKQLRLLTGVLRGMSAASVSQDKTVHE